MPSVILAILVGIICILSDFFLSFNCNGLGLNECTECRVTDHRTLNA